jgi:hypothetical protein
MTSSIGLNDFSHSIERSITLDEVLRIRSRFTNKHCSFVFLPNLKHTSLCQQLLISAIPLPPQVIAPSSATFRLALSLIILRSHSVRHEDPISLSSQLATSPSSFSALLEKPRASQTCTCGKCWSTRQQLGRRKTMKKNICRKL